MTELSIIIPVYNEQGNIGRLVKKINSVLSFDFEIIVVNDGSTDSTLDELRLEKCQIIDLKENMGKGYAMRKGIAFAKGKYCLFIGGDGQDDPKEIITLYNKIKEGYDCVIGSRFIQSTQLQNRYSQNAVLPVNEFGNKTLTFMINLLFQKKITDSQAEFKIYETKKLRSLDLVSNRFEIETEMLIKSFRKKFSIIEMPVHRYERVHGISKLFNIPFGRFLFGMRVLVIIIKGFLIWR